MAHGTSGGPTTKAMVPLIPFIPAKPQVEKKQQPVIGTPGSNGRTEQSGASGLCPRRKTVTQER
ncbi:hypothetical protein MAR_037337 [Mya arenaria]|uniref:Uncharacterized protein n=1 Tax=Mya arenaria TaxID=6604 RepID=A0ABY7FN77_MYAAR|nr:hypothetical protein MAR_037337 [Mya arenaria]